MSTQTNNKPLFLGPIFVAIAAMLWATDYIFRPNLTNAFGFTLEATLQFVFFEHLIAVTFLLIVLILYYVTATNSKESIDFNKFKTLNKTEIFSAFWIGICGSALGLVFFSLAFAEAIKLTEVSIYSGFDQTLFVQKIQPIIAISLAYILLKEKLPKNFFIFAGLTVIGVMFVTFGKELDVLMSINLNDPSIMITVYALLAAICWGSSTVFGRILVKKLDFPLTTLTRYGIATVFLLIINLINFSSFISSISTVLNVFSWLILAALVPGVISLFIYYYGLKNSKASYATIAELTFPFAGVLVNHLFNEESMYITQWAGGIVIVISITFLAFYSIKNDRSNIINE